MAAPYCVIVEGSEYLPSFSPALWKWLSCAGAFSSQSVSVTKDCWEFHSTPSQRAHVHGCKYSAAHMGTHAQRPETEEPQEESRRVCCCTNQVPLSAARASRCSV